MIELPKDIFEHMAATATAGAVFFPIGSNIIDLGLTPNRTDAFGHIGVCRDLLAYFYHRGHNLSMKIPATTFMLFM